MLIYNNIKHPPFALKKYSPVLLALLFCWSSNVFGAEDEKAINYILKFWDYSDPALSEERFRELIPTYEAGGQKSIVAVLQTQIARTHSLRRQFSIAHQMLDEVRKQIGDEKSNVMVLYLLERGRTFNSAGERSKALPLFVQAWEIARHTENDYLAVDAAHMVAIAEEEDNQLKWNMKALLLAEASANLVTREWLGSLYNNIGWTYFNQENYDQALEMFNKGVDFRKLKGQPERLRIAIWTLGRTYRAMGKLNKALGIQQQLEQELMMSNLKPDGFVYEELAELYLQLDNPKAGTYFLLAYEIISKDAWFVANEPERIERLKKMSESGE